jgi:acylglycerol lipase
MKRVLIVGVLAAATALTSCAPVIHSMGPVVTTPAIEITGADTILIAPDGVRLPVQTWQTDGKPKAIFLALHGFNDYANGVAMPAADWAKQGIVTYAYDQRGFGRAPHRGYWAGTAAMTADLRTAASLLKRRHPDVPLYLLGISMGGAVAMAALADAPVTGVDGAILVGPAVWGRAHMPWYQRTALWFFSNTIPWFPLTGEGLNRRPSDNIPMLRALGRDPLIIRETRIDTIKGLVDLMDAAYDGAARIDHTPVLMIYGLKDEIVPKAPVLHAMRSLPRRAGTKRAVYDASWHMMLRDLKAEIVWRDIAGWVADRTGALASGADKKAEAILSKTEDQK